MCIRDRLKALILGRWYWAWIKYCQIDRLDYNFVYCFAHCSILVFNYDWILTMSAKNTWKLHRWSTILLLPLVAYLFIKIIHLSTLPYQLILSEFSNLRGVGFILIFTVLGLIHMNTGVHEILDDYVHSDVVKKILNVIISIFFLLILIFVCLSLLLIFIG